MGQGRNCGTHESSIAGPCLGWRGWISWIAGGAMIEGSWLNDGAGNGRILYVLNQRWATIPNLPNVQIRISLSSKKKSLNAWNLRCSICGLVPGNTCGFLVRLYGSLAQMRRESRDCGGRRKKTFVRGLTAESPQRTSYTRAQHDAEKADENTGNSSRKWKGKGMSKLRSGDEGMSRKVVIVRVTGDFD